MRWVMSAEVIVIKVSYQINRCPWYWGAAAVLLLILLASGCGPKLQLTPLEPAPPPATADSGMVVAAHPLAAETGVAMLREGGNAVDAALAALFMLNVVEPYASGLGGGGFALVRTAAGDAKVVVYRERAPKNLDPAYYTDPADTNHTRMWQGGSAVCVPGAASGWAELYDRWGTLPLERLARDAIKAAEEGFIVDRALAGQITANLEKIQADSLLMRAFLKDGLLPYAAGDTLRQPELAATLRALTERGLRSFYRGPITEAVVKAAVDGGSAMNLEDLAFYRAEVVDPVKTAFNGYELLTIPPPSGGGLALTEALNLFTLTGATAQGAGSPEGIHLMAQCLEQAYADAGALIEDGTPEAVWRQMTTEEHWKEAAQEISLTGKPTERKPIAAVKLSDAGNTTHLVVVDRFGNAVSLTQSINYFFGSGVMAPGTGLLLNNQMADFDLPPATNNIIAPHQRPRSNMTPIILVKDGQSVLVLGTPGGARIVSTMAQLVSGITADGRDISAAIDYPRFFPAFDSTTHKHHLVMENRFTRETIKKLKHRGYEYHLAGPYHHYFGGAHGIMIDPSSGKLYGAADRRRGGAARGY